jgi:hypothetical protein
LRDVPISAGESEEVASPSSIRTMRQCISRRRLIDCRNGSPHDMREPWCSKRRPTLAQEPMAIQDFECTHQFIQSERDEGGKAVKAELCPENCGPPKDIARCRRQLIDAVFDQAGNRRIRKLPGTIGSPRQFNRVKRVAGAFIEDSLCICGGVHQVDKASGVLLR